MLLVTYVETVALHPSAERLVGKQPYSRARCSIALTVGMDGVVIGTVRPQAFSRPTVEREGYIA